MSENEEDDQNIQQIPQDELMSMVNDQIEYKRQQAEAQMQQTAELEAKVGIATMRRSPQK